MLLRHACVQSNALTPHSQRVHSHITMSTSFRAVTSCMLAVKRFNSSMSMQTCNSTGTMVLLDNDYITVSSQTEPVPTAEVGVVVYNVTAEKCDCQSELQRWLRKHVLQLTCNVSVSPKLRSWHVMQPTFRTEEEENKFFELFSSSGREQKPSSPWLPFILCFRGVATFLCVPELRLLNCSKHGWATPSPTMPQLPYEAFSQD
eukprot:1146700-Pelagomonas_calceolata.AAC.1